MSTPLLQLLQVSKQFNDGDERGTVQALDNLDLTVENGEFLVILGPSGCGKSTLLRMIAGLLKPSSGKCLYQGELITKPSLERGYVFQDPRLFPWLTVLENIELASANGNGEKLLKTMELAEFAKALPHELSGGMAQRVALARALAARPRLVLFDEPLANLDLGLRKTLQAELHQIWQEEGITCILVTHDLDEALALATRIVLLSKRPGTICYDQLIDLPFPRKHCGFELSLFKTKILEWMEVPQ